MTDQEKLYMTKIESALNKRATAFRLLDEASEEIRLASEALRKLGDSDARIDS